MGARARRLLVGLLVLAGTLPLLGPNPAVGAGDPARVRIPQLYLDQELTWSPCDFDYYLRTLYPGAPATNCASIVVPMDWRHPDAHPDITLSIALSRGTGRSRGLLTLNPGGPGVPAVDNTALFATARPRMFADFDLLGFDPRGFGQSSRARCSASSRELEALPLVPDRRVRNPATHRAEVAPAQLAARACAGEELNPFVGTEQTVHDLEFLRAYLSARQGPGATSYDKLNYIGYSYGTWLGAWYADTYPEHTGRFVLDSNLDWTASQYANQASDSASFQRRRDQMFFPWVARHARSYGLGRTPAAVRRSYERIRAGVLRSYRAGLSPVSAEDLDADLLLLLYTDDGFAEAAVTLVDYAQLAQPATVGADAARRRTLAAAAEDDEELQPSQVVRCNDSAYSRDIPATLRRTDRDARRYPFVGYWNSVSMCNYWSFPSSTRRIDLTGAPVLLMLQSEGDPAAAYEGALAAHRATAAHTRLVSVDDGGQHGLYLSGVSPCVERLADRFLFDGQLPRTDTTCASRPLPGDTKVYPLAGPVVLTRPAAAGSSAGPTGPRAPATARAVVRDLQRRVAEQESR